MQDLEDYDNEVLLSCKVEPLQRQFVLGGGCDEGRANTDAGSAPRAARGAERASLPVWEGNKVINTIFAHWSFEECWNYLRKSAVPSTRCLRSVGFSSLGDVQTWPAKFRRPAEIPRPGAPPRRAPPPRLPCHPAPPNAHHTCLRLPQSKRRCRSRSG